MPRSRLALAVLAAALSCIGDGRSLAEDGPRAARARLDPAEASESSWIGPDGRKRLLFRPRFVPPPLLLAGVLALNVGPMDVVLDAVRSRILVTGTPDQVEDALHVFSYVDVPTPEVLVEVAVVETACHCRSETGGHTYFDRTGGPDTFFRSFRYDFEPEAWLRAQQVGERPFQGASVRLGDSRSSGTLAGTIEAVLRGLAHDGSSDVVARPSLVLTEGVPAHVESTLALPVLLFERSDTPWQRQATRRRVGEKTGVRLDVTAEMVGSDGARLTIHPWVRRVAAAEADEGPLGLPTLAVSELLTTIHVADGETVLVGGIEGRRRVRGRRGLPLLDALPALDGALSAREGEAEETDLQVLLRARILRPGRAPPRFAPPCEAERLRARAAAEGLKGQPAGASRAGASPVK